MRQSTATARMTQTLTKKDLSAMLQQELQLPAPQANVLVHAFFTQICAALERQQQVKLYGFGNFTVQQKAARPGRNPKTGEAVTITARKAVVFRPGKKLKDMLNAS